MSEKKQRAKAPTMSDVARLAGVNRVTASVALSGARAATHVSEATRQRIFEAARQLGYTPNAIALALRQQRTDIVGYYIGRGYPNTHDPFAADVINGLHTGCKKYRQDLLMYSGFERESPDEIYAALANGKIDGLVLLPAPSEPVIEKLVNSHLPIVAIANAIPTIPSVVVDDAGGSRMIAEYLARQGHRRVLYRDEPYQLTSPVRRLAAFRETAAEHGMDVVVTMAGDWDGHLSRAEQELLAKPLAQRPTVAVCWADTYAYALLEDCRRLGLRVPEDLAVVGFDGIKTRITPAQILTTVRAPWAAVAEKTIDMLMEVIEGQAVEHEIVFPVELVVGDTA